MKEYLGRQPQPTTVTVTGEEVDVEYWINHLMRAAEFKDDRTQRMTITQFKIYPRAVND